MEQKILLQVGFHLTVFFYHFSLTMEHKPGKGFYQSGNYSGSSSSALCTLFLFSIAMFTLPFAAYYETIYVLEKHWNIPFAQSYIYGVVAAVIMVHIIIIAYIVKAFLDDEHAEPPKED